MGGGRQTYGGEPKASECRLNSRAQDAEEGKGKTRPGPALGVVLSEIHVDGGRDDAIIPGVAPIAPEIRRPAADVVDHATEEVNLPPPVRGAGTAVGRGCPDPGSSTAGDLIEPHGATARIRIGRHPFGPEISDSTCSQGLKDEPELCGGRRCKPTVQMRA